MIEAVFDPAANADTNVRAIIRSAHSGMCSGEPRNITYPGVPSSEEVLAALGLRPGQRMSETQWFAACDIVDPE